MSENKMSRLDAAEALEEILDYNRSLSPKEMDALRMAMSELRKPNGADLIDSFLEKVSKADEVYFSYKDRKYWCYFARLVFRETTKGCNYGKTVDFKTLFEIIKKQDKIEWENTPNDKPTPLDEKTISLLKGIYHLGFYFIFKGINCDYYAAYSGRKGTGRKLTLSDSLQFKAYERLEEIPEEYFDCSGDLDIFNALKLNGVEVEACMTF